ncbi:hypothetical protein [Actinomadura terrae]|uniref:hypothetical protein n=1 Tax=Actinomadura terrae TaxID=604353 RepID=UPI001FA800E5|nr:hypothetical protein [Actinomadura terrae]
MIGSAAFSVLNASGYIYNKVPSAPGNHAKVSDNLYPGYLSEFNYLVEGDDAVRDLLKTYWDPIWKYSGKNAVKA